MSKQYDFGRWHFDTQRELNITVKYLLSQCPKNEEFENEFFKELIQTYHEGVRYEGLKITKFKIITFNNQVGKWKYAQERFRGNFLVTGFFEPVGEWHGVTIYPYKKQTVKGKLIESLRQRWSETAEVRKEGQLCEECKVIPYPQLHHHNISFKKIAEKCLHLFTEKEMKIGINSSWWQYECECDEIPFDHPAVVEMFRLHKDVEYKWLCYECHKDEHKKRRGLFI